jgi:endonuclease YncB( thermonuclease family)
MCRALLCCLLVLLTACAGPPPPTSVAPSATATRVATATVQQAAPPMVAATATNTSVAGGARPCPAGQPVKGVGAEDGSLRAVVPGEAEYERLPWLRCFATIEAAAAAGFPRRGVDPGGTATPGTPPASGSAGEELALVVRVIDALTIEVRLGDGQIVTVRYLGVDVPEGCDGSAGGAHNAALVGGRTVRLERDVSERDRFERLLRYVWVAGDGGVARLANEEVVRGGHAVVAVAPPDVKYEQRLLAAEREASGAGLGLWGACAGQLVPPVTPTATPLPPAPTPTPLPPTPAPPTLVPPTPVPPTPEPPPPPPPTATATPEPAPPTATQRAATATRVPPTATRPPVVAPTATPGQACHPSYPTLCLPGAPDLDCADIPQKAFPVRPPDPHGLDGDKDGIGCEN